MRRATALLLAVIALAGLAGCAANSTERPQIVVTTNILGDVVSELVGDAADVTVLMQPNADPHSFGVSAQDAAAMASADLLVSSGLGLEEGLQQHLDAAATAGTPQFVAGAHVDVIDYAAGMPDPHFWTDPAQMIAVVDALTTRLGDVEGLDEPTVGAAAAAYRAELAALDADMTEVFASIPRGERNLVTNHHVFGYLAERFDFTVIGTVIPGATTLAAPSAADLRDIVDAVTAAGVRTVFAESSSPDRLMQVLADEAGIDVTVVSLVSESLTTHDGEAPTYLDMMRVNTARITDGLTS